MPDDRVRVSIDTDVSKSVSPLRQLAQQFTNTEKQTNELIQVFSGLFARTEQLERGMSRQAQTIQKLNTNYQNLSIRAKGVQAALSQKATALRRSERETSRLQTQLSKTRLTLGNFGDQLGNSARLMGQYSGRISAVIPFLKNFQVALPVVGVLAFGKAVQSSLQTFSRWEVQLRQATALGNLTEQQTQNLSLQLRELARTTRFTSEEVGKAYNDLLRATGDVAGSHEILEVAIDGAIAGMIEVSTLTPKLVGILRGFNLELSEAGRVMDALTSASIRTNITLSELASSAAFVVSSAGALGLEVEETTAALGVLANAGFLASRSGPALRTFLAGLVSPTQRLQERFDELGIRLTNSRGEFIGLIPALEEMREKGFQTSEMLVFFRQRAGAAGSALLDFLDVLIALENQIVKSRGETKRQADEIEKTYVAAVRRLTSAYEDLQITFTEFLESNEAAASVVTTVAGAFNFLSDTIQNTDKRLDNLQENINNFPEEPVRFISERENDLLDRFDKTLDSIVAKTSITTDQLERTQRALSINLSDFEIKPGIDTTSALEGIERIRNAFRTVIEDAGFIDEEVERQRAIAERAFQERQNTSASRLQFLENEGSQLRRNLSILENERATRGRDAKDEETIALEKTLATTREAIRENQRAIEGVVRKREEDRASYEATLAFLESEEVAAAQREAREARARSNAEKAYQEETVRQANRQKQLEEFYTLVENPPQLNLQAPAFDEAFESLSALPDDIFGAFNATPDLDKAVAKTKEMDDNIDNLVESLEQGMRSAFSYGNSFLDIFQRIGRIALSSFANFGINSLLSGITGRQSGGQAQSGRGYIVGEKRPELFIPQNSGKIYPDVPGQTTNNYFTLQGTGNFAEDVLTIAEAVRNNS